MCVMCVCRHNDSKWCVCFEQSVDHIAMSRSLFDLCYDCEALFMRPFMWWAYLSVECVWIVARDER